MYWKNKRSRENRKKQKKFCEDGRDNEYLIFEESNSNEY
jgi:hypothetical protein